MFLDALLKTLDPFVLLLVSLGTVSGLLVGALPGLSVTMATAILVSITYGWPVEHAFAMIIGIYCAGVFAGSIPSVLLNIPGTPAAIVTGYDGYPLAKEGQASFAMGLARIGSFFGGMIGVVFLAVFAPMVTIVALSFSPFEYLALVVLGLVTIGSLGEGSFLNAILAALIGFVISCVGLDPIYGIGRFTFGQTTLASGLDLVPCLIGVFGLSEVLFQLKNLKKGPGAISKVVVGRVVPKFKTFVKMIPLIIRSSIIGVWIGALPGEGGAIAALLSYDSAKRNVKNPSRPFGEGAYEGVVAPEVSNNAAVGGAMITLLTLGVPGDAVTAVMIGAFMIHGLRPGPLLMETSADLFWYIVSLLLIANILFLFIGLLATKYLPRIITSVRKEILMPIVSVLCIVGAFALQSSMFDVYLTIMMGILGYIFKLSNFPVGPLVIGIVLGPIGDGELRRAIMSSDVNFFLTFLHHPIALFLLAIAAWQIINQIGVIKTKRREFTARVLAGVKKRFSS